MRFFLISDQTNVAQTTEQRNLKLTDSDNGQLRTITACEGP